MAHEVTFIPGDGTGPELAEATRRVLEATGVAFDWDVQQAGIDEYESSGDPFPPATLASLKRTSVGIKGPITTPVGSGFRSVNVLAAQGARPVRLRAPVQVLRRRAHALPEIDIVIVRENTEDLYAGIEFEAGEPDNARVRIGDSGGTSADDARGLGLPSSRSRVFGSERIVSYAFAYARATAATRSRRSTRPTS